MQAEPEWPDNAVLAVGVPTAVGPAVAWRLAADPAAVSRARRHEALHGFPQARVRGLAEGDARGQARCAAADVDDVGSAAVQVGGQGADLVGGHGVQWAASRTETPFDVCDVDDDGGFPTPSERNEPD